MILNVANECRPIQVILRSFKKFRRQEVVPERRVEKGYGWI